jgi:acetylornithine deacetylase
VFDFEIRHLPGDDPDALLAEFRNYVETALQPEMNAVQAGTGFSITPLSVLPALDNRAESEVVGLAQELSGQRDIGKVSFGTEGSQFQAAGIPTVVCGPGSIEQAHKPNEFVTVDQIEQCERFVRRLMDRLCLR